MSTAVQRRRESALFLSTYTGPEGEFLYDQTTGRLITQDGTKVGGFPQPTALAVKPGSGAAGSTNTSSSGSGTDHDHTLNYSIPANFLVADRMLRVTAIFYLNTGAAAPTLVHKLKAGSVVLAQNDPIAVANSLANKSIALQWLLQATADPSGASNVEAAMLGTPIVEASASGAWGGGSITAQPVAVATNAAITLQVATRWATAGTGVNTIQLRQFLVEALN